jgi:hypothetical protein
VGGVVFAVITGQLFNIEKFNVPRRFMYRSDTHSQNARDLLETHSAPAHLARFGVTLFGGLLMWSSLARAE